MSLRWTTGVAMAWVLLVFALAPIAAAQSASAPLSPVLQPLFPVLERFVDRVESEGPAPSPANGEDQGTVDVNVTFSIRSPGTPIPVFRFYSVRSATHFYTPSAEERDMVLARWPDVWTYEGVAYMVNPAKNSQVLYRFYNHRVGSHFYTASPAERDTVLARWPDIYSYDGPTYAVTPGAEGGKTPVYRFYNLKNGSHFYTASAEERDTVLARWPDIYRLEGAAFWLGQ